MVRAARYPIIGLLLLLAAAASGCTSGPSSTNAQPVATGANRARTQLRTAAWPEAARKFRSRGDWLGADSAYSIDLGAGRVLWLFGDTFIDPSRDGTRTNGPNVFIRNSIALQTASQEDAAYDLSRSDLTFHFRSTAGQASSYFPEPSADHWYWPLHGARLPGGQLLVFRMRVAKRAGGLGFGVVGWDAVAVDDPDADPAHWSPRVIAAVESADRLLGASVLLHDRYLYAYAAKNDDRDHSAYLARWPVAALTDLQAGALDEPDWFTTSGTFERAAAGADVAVVLAGAQTEFSVHFDRGLGQFIQVQMRGLFVSDPSTGIVLRRAARPEGPWSETQLVYQPETSPNAGDPDKLVAYAAKAHPEQRGPALVLTYVINQLEALAPSDSVYYPEVLRLDWQGAW